MAKIMGATYPLDLNVKLDYPVATLQLSAIAMKQNCSIMCIFCIRELSNPSVYINFFFIGFY